MSRIFLNRALIVLISLTCLLIFLFPYSLVFFPGDEAGTEDWVSSYVYDDIILLIIYVPFIIAWIISLFLKKGLARKIAKFFLVSLSFLYFGIGLLSLVMIAQDVVPYIGLFITILLFPLVLGYVINERKRE